MVDSGWVGGDALRENYLLAVVRNLNWNAPPIAENRLIPAVPGRVVSESTMGFAITIETERGERLDETFDPKNVLGNLLPTGDDSNSLYLRYIDRYADTVFNHLQMGPFLVEWRQLYDAARSEEERDILHRVEEMAKKVQHEYHWYLKFYGD